MTTANPYAPPTNDEEFVAPARSTGPLPDEFRPSEGIATALRVVLGVSALALLVDVAVTWNQIDLLARMRDGGVWSMPEAEANDARVRAVNGVYLLLLLIGAILWSVWHNRTNTNARALGADRMEFGPNAWGWFACPLFNLWKPVQAVNELWVCSDPRNTATMTPPSVFGLWWAMWIIGSVLGQISWRLVSREPNDIDTLIHSSWAGLGSSVALIGAAAAAILVVTAIQRRVAGALAGRR
jgi:hypothetical protein